MTASRTTLWTCISGTGLLLAAPALAVQWTAQQLTYDSYDHYSLRVAGNRVAWIGATASGDSAGDNMFLREGGAIQQVTLDGWVQRIALSESRTVWMSGMQIYSRDGGVTRSLSTGGGEMPEASGANVIWSGPGYDILLNNGASTRSIGSGMGPAVSGSNVAWFDVPTQGFELNVSLFNGTTTTEIMHGGFNQGDLKLSGNHVLWQRQDSASPHGYHVMYYDGSSVRQMDAPGSIDVVGGTSYAVSGDWVAWSDMNGIELYNGSTTTTLGAGSHPQVAGNRVVWINNGAIRVYDGDGITTLSGYGLANQVEMSDSTIAWTGWDGQHYQVFMATVVPEPATLTLLAVAFLVALPRRR